MVEFAFVLPVLLLLLFAAFDFGHAMYAQAVLHGAVQNAGRDAGLQSGGISKDAIDALVLKQVKAVVPNGAVLASRKNYEGFSDVGRAEDFVDANSNDTYDPTECFTDENDNLMWDADVGAEGLGGADDVVLYTVELSYERSFPFWAVLGGSRTTSIAASTTLRNQPFGSQAARQEVSVCPPA